MKINVSIKIDKHSSKEEVIKTIEKFTYIGVTFSLNYETPEGGWYMRQYNPVSQFSHKSAEEFVNQAFLDFADQEKQFLQLAKEKNVRPL